MESVFFEKYKNEFLIFLNMLSVRYPWTLWGLGNVPNTFLEMFLRPLRGPDSLGFKFLRSPGVVMFSKMIKIGENQ